MNFGFTAFDVAKIYGLVFQDEKNVWLVCRNKADITLCRCLDTVELGIVLLWLDKDHHANTEIILNPPEPYIVGIQCNGKTNLLAGIPLCRPSKSLQLVQHNELYNYSPKPVRDFWYLEDKGFELLISILCLYDVNTNICREKLIEYYFYSDWNTFAKYVQELKKWLDNSDLLSEKLQKHLQLVQRVLSWFCREDDAIHATLEDNITDMLYLENVRSNLGGIAPKLDYIRDSMKESFYIMFDRTKVSMDESVVEDVYNIARIIKDKNLNIWEKNKEIFISMSHSLDIIYKAASDGNEKREYCLNRLKALVHR